MKWYVLTLLCNTEFQEAIWWFVSNLTAEKVVIFLKVFIEFVTILLLFYILVFWPQGMCDLSTNQESELETPDLEGKDLTTGSPGKSQDFVLIHLYCKYTVFHSSCIL